MRSSRRISPLALALLASAAACSNPQSFIVLNLRVASVDLMDEIAGITDVLVTVERAIPVPGETPPTLTYDATVLQGGSLTLTKAGDRTLSVSFSGDVTGTVEFTVYARDASHC